MAGASPHYDPSRAACVEFPGYATKFLVLADLQRFQQRLLALYWLLLIAGVKPRPPRLRITPLGGGLQPLEGRAIVWSPKAPRRRRKD